MTPAALLAEAIKREHRSYISPLRHSERCGRCNEEWPCYAIQAAVALERRETDLGKTPATAPEAGGTARGTAREIPRSVPPLLAELRALDPLLTKISVALLSDRCVVVNSATGGHTYFTDAEVRSLVALRRTLLPALIATLEEVPPCGTCGGVPPASGLPCVCEGTNSVYMERQGLSDELFNAIRRAEAAEQALQRVQAERDTWKERLRATEVGISQAFHERDEFRAKRDRLREVLAVARVAIKALHGPIAWNIYEADSPEMQAIDAALAGDAPPGEAEPRA